MFGQRKTGFSGPSPSLLGNNQNTQNFNQPQNPQQNFFSNKPKNQMFGNNNTQTPSMFGNNQNTQKPSMFGNNNTQTPSMFGNTQNTQKPSMFGNTQKPSMFGNTQKPSMFGNTQNPMQSNTQNSMFGNTQNRNQSTMFGNQNRVQNSPFGNNQNKGSMFGNQRTGTSSMFQQPGQNNMNLNQNRFLQKQTNYFQRPNLEIDTNGVGGNFYRDDGWKKVKNSEMDFKYNFLLRKNPEVIVELNDMNTYNSKKFSEMGQEQRFQQMVKAIDDLVNLKSKEIKNVLETIKNIDTKLEKSIYIKTKSILMKFEKLNLVLKDFRLKLKKLQNEFSKIKKILENQQRQMNKLKNDYQMNYTIPSKMSLKINKILQEKIKQLKLIILDLLEIYKCFNENTNINESEFQMEENLDSLREMALYISGLLSDADEIGNFIGNLKRNRLGVDIDDEGEISKNVDVYDVFEQKIEIVKNKLENFN